jgi:menaquinone-dependent protoporphyrinogen oxidase
MPAEVTRRHPKQADVPLTILIISKNVRLIDAARHQVSNLTGLIYPLPSWHAKESRASRKFAPVADTTVKQVPGTYALPVEPGTCFRGVSTALARARPDRITYLYTRAVRQSADGHTVPVGSAWAMGEQVLIAYGSKHGSTAATAECIGDMLRERGLDVQLSPAAEVQSLAPYAAVIVGGAIYTGRWHPDAKRFYTRFKRRVAYFAMGPKSSSEEDLATAKSQLARYHLEPLTIFGGVIDPDKLHFPFNRMPVTDARDWSAIHAFADAFAARVSSSPPAAAA